MNCSNCDSRLSCGCQRKIASDGRACCNGCIAAYENKLSKPQPAQTLEKFINTNSPSVWGANRYVQTIKK